jgi:methyl-accepting chemotaxis protein
MTSFLSFYYTNSALSAILGIIAAIFIYLSLTYVHKKVSEIQRAFSFDNQNITPKICFNDLKLFLIKNFENKDLLEEEYLHITQLIKNTDKKLKQTLSEQKAFFAEQNSAINQIVSTIKELSVTSDQTTEKALLVVDSADQSIDISKRGHEAFKKTVESMKSIRAKVERIAVRILDLSEQTQKIGMIINTVNELSEFTNLLALNASIEASKAGEYGRGFSVVASEIRQLSVQSQTAVSEIEEIISEIQNATNSSVMATEEGTKEVDVGVNLINRASSFLQDSLNSLHENSSAAKQILAANKQQTIGIEQITYAISGLNDAIHKMTIEMATESKVLDIIKEIRLAIEKK